MTRNIEHHNPNKPRKNNLPFIITGNANKIEDMLLNAKVEGEWDSSPGFVLEL